MGSRTDSAYSVTNPSSLALTALGTDVPWHANAFSRGNHAG
jgi:hypothetical protein